MSKYTTELRYICETLSGESDYNKAIEKSRPLIFDFDYPFFNQVQKERVEKAFLLNYYNREIAYETYELWKLKLQNELNMIMYSYIELYKSIFDDLDTFLTFKTTNNTTGESKQVSSGTSREVEDFINRNLFSDTPQGPLSGVENGEYLTNFTKNTDNNLSTTTNSQTNEDTTKNLVVTSGFQGKSVHELIAERRKNIIDVDSMIVNDLEKLFFGLW